MAEETKLEDIAKNAPQEEIREEKKQKPVSIFRSVVNELSDLLGSSAKLGLAAAIPYAQATAFPHLARDTAVMAGAQVAADSTTNFKKGKKTTAGEIAKSSIVGTAVTAPVYYGYNLVNKIPLDSALGYFGKGVAWGGLVVPAFVGMYQSIDYVVRNMTFKGLGKYVKENYWPTLKRLWKYLMPFSLANIFFVPPFLQIPVGAALSYAFALFGAPKKGELKESEKRDKTPYIVAASRALSRGAYNLFYAPLKAAEAIGSAVRDLYKKTPATAPATQTAPTG